MSAMRPQYQSPDFELQKAIYDRLKAHSAMTTWKDSIFDEVPADQGCPYIKTGSSSTEDFGARDISGSDHTQWIEIFCDNKFKSGKKECKDIVKAILLAMTDTTLGYISPTGFRVILQRIDGMRILEEEGEDSISYHGIIELNYLVQPN